MKVWHIAAGGAAALALGAGVYYATQGRWKTLPKSLASIAPGKLVLYMNDPADSQHAVFVEAARQTGEALGVEPVGVSSADDILTAIRNGPAALSKVVFLVHGSDSWIGRNIWGIRLIGGDRMPAYASVDTLANNLAQKVNGSSIISLGACTADEVAEALRDGLVRRGITGSGEVRAKTTSGRVRANPNGIAFPLIAGAPGRIERFAEAGPESIAWTTLT